ncbi:polysaccharide biosynthesis protein [Candidatus Protochlamydia sp. W-9]|uniref:polysaccharide biosynthesis protein n=1 Tax=Candidatus Protochlamydia sp. W-9 TaxID=1785087 RepID=UPI00096ABB78|nr:polysaccharide biosynthesis protein [Candidatus Protochlamydia sp. W-9]
MICNERILITGGTGSLGKAITAILSDSNEVVVYSRNEERQFEMQQKINSQNITYLIGDIRDKSTLKQALQGCTLAIHAAAMKDMVMCEKQPTQCYLNNLEGSRSFIECINQSTVRTAIGISTDKASSPTNVYGMTKYIMERMFLEANKHFKSEFLCLRLGNLIDARGSLIFTWKKNPDQKISLTHSEVSRFFLTTGEGAKIVLDVLKKGSAGKIYIPKMKKANIKDILKIITGKTNFPLIGLFPGEKLHETLVSENESQYCFEEGNYFCLDIEKTNPNPLHLFDSGNAEQLSELELIKMIYAKE